MEKRRLAAILALDTVGYSRLMEADESGTLQRLKTARTTIVEPVIERHGGRVVKNTGDGVLVEFSSALEAVRCATEIQSVMAEPDSGTGAGPRLAFRIGINLGDVIVDGEDIYGEGVNVAARIEALAEAGGVCISGTVHEHVRGKIDGDWSAGGERKLKNIERPVSVWLWRTGRDDAAPSVASQPLPVPDKPSIAVLPFENLSGDNEQEYFADGLTEDLITELSRYRDLFVIARNSTFQYKGQPVDITRVSAELGVRYILEGSIRRAGNRVRVTAQLIAAGRGQHVWAERYDRDVRDIFAVQDEVVRSIVGALPARVEAADLESAKRKVPGNLKAYDYLLRAKEHHYRVMPDDNVRARELLRNAVSLDPEYANAYAWLACTYGQAFANGFLPWQEPHLGECETAAEKAYTLDSEDSEGHRILAEIRLYQRRHDEAWHHHERALALNPNDARIVSQRGEFHTWCGQPDEGIEWVTNAIRLDPSGSERRAVHLARAYFVAERFSEALDALARARRHLLVVNILRAACLAGLERIDEAKAEATEVMRMNPEFSVGRFLALQPYRDNGISGRFSVLLLAAGLPE